MGNQTAETEKMGGLQKPAGASSVENKVEPKITGKNIPLLTLQKSIGNRAVQRVLQSNRPVTRGMVQRVWNPPTYRNRLKEFADIAERQEQVYDWFSVEARSYATGGTRFMDTTPEPEEGREAARGGG